MYSSPYVTDSVTMNLSNNELINFYMANYGLNNGAVLGNNGLAHPHGVPQGTSSSPSSSNSRINAPVNPAEKDTESEDEETIKESKDFNMNVWMERTRRAVAKCSDWQVTQIGEMAKNEKLIRVQKAREEEERKKMEEEEKKRREEEEKEEKKRQEEEERIRREEDRIRREEERRQQEENKLLRRRLEKEQREAQQRKQKEVAQTMALLKQFQVMQQVSTSSLSTPTPLAQLNAGLNPRPEVALPNASTLQIGVGQPPLVSVDYLRPPTPFVPQAPVAHVAPAPAPFGLRLSQPSPQPPVPAFWLNKNPSPAVQNLANPGMQSLQNGSISQIPHPYLPTGGFGAFPQTQSSQQVLVQHNQTIAAMPPNMTLQLANQALQINRQMISDLPGTSALNQCDLFAERLRFLNLPFQGNVAMGSKRTGTNEDAANASKRRK